jgi:hypothetical protein
MQDSKELLTSVTTGIDSLAKEMAKGKSANFLSYLEFASKFHNYSLHNQWLIFMQKPKATRVTGFVGWKNLGRYPKKGTGISILAPRGFVKQEKRINKATGEEETRDKSGMYFVGVTVFDVSDTVGSDLPSWVSDTPSDEKDSALLDKLTTACKAWGYSVAYRDNMHDINGGDTQGYTTSNNDIVLKSGANPRRSLLVLIHEAAHQLCGHLDLGKRHTFSKQDRELQAEAVSYVVAHHFGLRNQDSADYLLSYGVVPEQLASNLQAINKVSKQIIEAIESQTSKQIMDDQAA